MIPLLKVSDADRKLLVGRRFKGPTPWLIAIQMFVMVIVAAAGLAVGSAVQILEQATSHQLTVQLPAGAAQGEALAAATRRVPGVERVTLVPDKEVRETLDRWLGQGARDANLPVPALVEVELAKGGSADRIRAALARTFPKAKVAANSATLAPMLRSLRLLGWVAASIVLLVAVAAGAAVVLATRAALAANRQTVAIMHGVGATDEQVSRLFQRRMAIDSLVGGLAGAGAAGLVLVLVAGTGLAVAGRLAMAHLLGPIDLLLLAALPFAGALLATMVARQAVIGALRAEP